MYICEACSKPFVEPNIALIFPTEDSEGERVSICPECGCPEYRELTAEEQAEIEAEEKRKAEEISKRIEEQQVAEEE